MPDLFKDLLADIYRNRQQNRASISASWVSVALLSKYPHKNDHIVNFFLPIIPLNANFKILAKALVDKLALVVDVLISNEQTCANLNRSIHDNFHLL